MLIWLPGLSQPAAPCSVTQIKKLPSLDVFIVGTKGLPLPIGAGLPIAGSVLYQNIVPPLPLANKEGVGSSTQINTFGSETGADGGAFTVTKIMAAVLSQLLLLVSVTQIVVVPAIFVLITGINGLPTPMGVGLPSVGSLSYQVIRPPVPFALKVGGTAFKQTGLG